MDPEAGDRARRIFVSYIDKSREYYRALGYERPYRWAHHGVVPFTPLGRPLASCRLGAVTTAAPDAASAASHRVWTGPSSPPPVALHTEHLFWDKAATHTRDVASFLPVRRLAEAAAAGRIGAPSPRFYGVPTLYSQRLTSERDAPEILRLCREDAVDAVLLVAL